MTEPLGDGAFLVCEDCLEVVVEDATALVGRQARQIGHAF